MPSLPHFLTCLVIPLFAPSVLHFFINPYLHIYMSPFLLSSFHFLLSSCTNSCFHPFVSYCPLVFTASFRSCFQIVLISSCCHGLLPYMIHVFMHLHVDSLMSKCLHFFLSTTLHLLVHSFPLSSFCSAFNMFMPCLHAYNL